MKVSASFWQSKTTWLAISATAIEIILCLNGWRLPTAQEITTVVMAWGACFIRDTLAKTSEGQAQ